MTKEVRSMNRPAGRGEALSHCLRHPGFRHCGIRHFFDIRNTSAEWWPLVILSEAKDL